MPKLSKSDLLLFCALALALLGGMMSNSFLLPTYDAIFPYTRDISVLSGAAALVIVALIATWKPSLLPEKILTPLALIMTTAGFIGIFAALFSGSLPLLIVSAVMCAIGRNWLLLLVLIACCTRGSGKLFFGVPCALVVATVIDYLARFLGFWPCAVIVVALPIITTLLARTTASPIFEASRANLPPADAALSRPDSFLPFTHKIFWCFFLFKVVHGFSLRFSGENTDVLALGIVVILLMAFAAWFIFSKRRNKTDLFFAIAVFLVIAGFLLQPLGSLAGYSILTGDVLRLGSAVFDIVFWVTILRLAAGNPAGAIPIFSWSVAVNILGTTVGANLGIFVYAGASVAATTLISAAIALVLLAYGYFIMGEYSFTDTMTKVTPYEPPVVTTEKKELEEACAELGKRYGLTPRETEVFTLLARGRNNPFIQEELVLSRNTVKSHTKHIYTKMDAHSQQELIDSVEHFING